MVGEVLSHPLVLLATGALLSGWLVPRLTQRWQDQRKALDIKADLVERVAQAVTEMFMAVQLVQVGAKSFGQDDFDAAYQKWQKDKAVLTSLLRAYFRSSDVDHEWIRCRALTTAYYVQAGIRADDRRSAYLNRVAMGISLAQPDDWSDEVAGGADAEADNSHEAVVALSDVSILRQEVRSSLNRTVEAIVDKAIAV